MYDLLLASALLAVQLGGTIAQLRKTYQLKNADDLSIPMLFLFCAGMFHSVPYAFLSEMELPYKIAFILQTILVIYLTLLAIRYRSNLSHKHRLRALLAALACIGAASWALSAWSPAWSTNMNGFLMAAIFGIRSFPQMYHTWKRKSVKGLTAVEPLVDFIYSSVQLSLSFHFGHGGYMVVSQARLVGVSCATLIQYCYYKLQEA